MADSPSILETLPTEVVELIAERVTPTDLLPFRLTCRTLNRKLQRVFGILWFTSIRISLSSHGLSKLQAISRCEQIREYVHDLTINDGSSSDFDKCLGREFFGRRKPSGHLYLLRQTPCTRMLQDLLTTCFTNCRSFGIYGRNSVGHCDLDRIHFDDALNLIFTVIANNGLPLKSFAIIAPYATVVDVFAYATDSLETRFREAWAHLQELRLVYPVKSPQPDLNNINFTTDHLIYASNIQVLVLLPGLDSSDTLLNQYIKAGGAPPTLRELKLYESHVDFDIIANLLDQCRHSLSKITLGGCVAFHQDNYIAWAEIIYYIRDSFEHLESFKLHSPLVVLGNDYDSKQLGHFDALRERAQAVNSPNNPFTVQFHDATPLKPIERTGPTQRPLAVPASLNVWWDWVNERRHFNHWDVYALSVQYDGPQMKEALTVIAGSINFIDHLSYEREHDKY